MMFRIFRKKPLIFTFVREQATFLTIAVGVLSFIALMSFGISWSVGAAVSRWNAQWDRIATVQIMPGGNIDAAQKILDGEKSRIISAEPVPDEDVRRLLKPWLSSSDALGNYVPRVIEVRLKRSGDADILAEKFAAEKEIKFMTFAAGASAAVSAGWKIMGVASAILALVVASIILCIFYATKNIAIIHRHELEILEQVGARDGFIVHQMQRALLKICAIATAIGAAIAAAAIFFVNLIAHGTRTGLMAQMDMTKWGWIAFGILAAGIMVMSLFAARKSVMKILTDATK